MRRNTAFLLAARLASATTTLIVLSVVSRFRGPEALGEIGLGLAIGAIFAAIADLGTATLLVREASRDQGLARLLLRRGLIVRTMIVPVLLLATLVIALRTNAQNPVLVVLVAAGLIGQQTAELTRSVFNAQQRMSISGSHAVLENLAWVAVICGAIAAGADLSTTFALGLVVWLGSITAGLILVKKLARMPRPQRPGQSFAETIQDSLPFGAFNLTGIASNRIDTVLLGLLLPAAGLAAAGAYFAAARLIAACEYLPDALSRARFPELARFALTDPVAVRAILGGTATNLLAVACLGPIIMVGASTSLMAILFGPGLADGAAVLAFMSFVLPFRFLGYIFGMTLTSADVQGRRVAAASVALLVVLAIDIPGIPAFGVAAAVAGALAASVALFVIYAHLVRSRFGSVGLRPASVAGIVAAMTVAIVAALSLGRVIPDVAAAGLGCFLYVSLLAIGSHRAGLRAIHPTSAGV